MATAADADTLFRSAQELLKTRKVAQAKAALQQAKELYTASGEVKKEKVMQAMLDRLEGMGETIDTSKPAAAAGSSSAAKADSKTAKASTGKGAFDYSKWDNIVDSDDDDDEKTAAPPPHPAQMEMAPPPLPKSITPRLFEALGKAEAVKAAGGSAAEVRAAEELAANAIAEAGPAARQDICKLLKQSGIEIPPALTSSFASGTAPRTEEDLGDAKAEEVQRKIEEMRRSMDADLARLTAQTEAMKAQEEALAAVRDPAELIAFMQRAGVEQGAIKAAVAAHEQGDHATVERVLMDSLKKSSDALQDAEGSEERVKQAEELAAAVAAASAEIGEEQMAKAGALKSKVEAAAGVQQQATPAKSKVSQASGFSFDKTKKKAESKSEGAAKAAAAAEQARRESGKEEGGRAKGKEEREEAEREKLKGGREEAEREKVKGNAAFGAGDFEAARLHFSRAIAASPTPNAGYLTNRAATNLRLQSFSAALADADAAIAADRAHVKAWFRKGQALEGLCRWDDALRVYEEGLELMPESEQLRECIRGVKQRKAESEQQQQNQTEAAAPPPVSTSSHATPARPDHAGAAKVPVHRQERTAESVVVYVEMPEKESLEGVDLEVSATSLQLSAPPHYSLSLSLPCTVSNDDAKAKWFKKTKTLKVTVPIALP